MAYQIASGMTRHISLSLDDNTWEHCKTMADARHLSMSAFFRTVMIQLWKDFEKQQRQGEAAAV
jgi:hypothetical protein